MLKTPVRSNKSFIASAALTLIASLFLSGVAATRAYSKTDWQKCDPRRDKSIYVIGYAHLDTQWRWTYQDSINKFIPNTMRFNFDLIDKYPDYHFNFTGSRRYMMMKEYYPADYARVKDYIAKGRWYISGSSVDENDANVPTPESVIRQVLYGNHYFQKEFGKTSVDYMLPDCFGFPASLPSALAHAGLKGFSTQKLTWGSPVGIPFNVGVWEGLDGHSVAAALNPGSYGSDLIRDMSHDENWLERAQDNGDKTGFYADFKYYGTGDIGGSPTEESVRWLEKSLDADGPLCVIPGSSDQIFRDMRPENISKMPRYKGDLLLTQHSAGSLTSQAYMKRWNRKNELLIDNAERASVIADWLGTASYPLDKLTKNWALILGSQMHDILPGTSLPKAYEFSWNDEVIALNNSAGTLQDAVGAIARLLDTRVQGVPLIVYNPLSMEREDIVQSRVRFPGAAPAYIRVFDPVGKEVPAQIVERNGGDVEIAFLAKVPSIGLAVFDIRKSDKPGALPTSLSVTNGSLENKQYRVRLDKNGDVSSVYDKVAGRELLSAPARLAFLEDSPREWPAWNTDYEDWMANPKAFVSGPAKVRVVENGPARVALEVVRHSEGSVFNQFISLSAGNGGDRLEFRNQIDWRTRERCLKATFPLAARNKTASYNLGMGVIDRPNNDTGKYEVPSRQWFDLTDASGDFGVAVLEDSKFGSDKPDDGTLRLTLLRTPKGRSYFDQETQDLGRHQILYALAGHKGSWNKSDISWRGARLNQPPIAFTPPIHNGTLGRSFSFFKINSSQVQVAALKKAEDSDEIVLRLQELTGQPANGVAVSFASPIASAREIDGQERAIGGATVKDGALIVDMAGFSPKSFAIKLRPVKHIAGTPVSAPVKLAFNADVASLDGEKSGGNFDGKGDSFAGETLPANINVDGISFNLGGADSGVNNAITCDGRTISLPAGKHNRLYLLAASSGGDVTGEFKIDGKPVSLRIQEWRGYVGQWDNRIWKTERDISGLQPAFIKRDEIAWYASHRHNGYGENEAYNYSYIFKYGLDIPATAKSLTLPNNASIKIFAVTAAYNENDDTRPAQMLYDDFKKPVDAPIIAPASGKHADSVLVSIGKSWYAGYDQVRITTDGGEPTLKSPLYAGPFWVRKSAVVQARVFEQGGQKGAISKATFDIKDTTPPRIANVSAYDGYPSIMVEYSEPVDKASAESVSNYRVEPDLGIVSASLNADGRAALLKISTAPNATDKYTLTVGDIRDTSQAANKTSAPVNFVFSITPPVFELKFKSGDSSINLGFIPPDRTFRAQGSPNIGQGKFGIAIKLTGDGQCVIVDDLPSLNPSSAISLSVWIRPDDWEGNRRILQKGDDDNQYQLFKDGDKLAFAIDGVGAVKGPLPSAGQWHHVAATYDGASMRLFVDGAEIGESKASGSIHSTPDPLHIGAKNTRSTKSDFFKGMMDKITIWNYAISEDRVRELAIQGKAKN